MRKTRQNHFVWDGAGIEAIEKGEFLRFGIDLSFKQSISMNESYKRPIAARSIS
jgi:hypothetical protein